MTDPQVSELGRAVQEVTERVQLLVREEIALAQAEMTQKIQKLIRGIVAGAIAVVFALAGLIYLLHSASWGVWEILGVGEGPWLGYLIVTLVLFLLGAILALLAYRLHQEGDAAHAGAGDRGGAPDPRDRRRLPAGAPGHRRT